MLALAECSQRRYLNNAPFSYLSPPVHLFVIFNALYEFKWCDRRQHWPMGPAALARAFNLSRFRSRETCALAAMESNTIAVCWLAILLAVTFVVASLTRLAHKGAHWRHFWPGANNWARAATSIIQACLCWLPHTRKLPDYSD